MSPNDPNPSHFVKICPNCSYKNDAYRRRCLQCDKNLAGIPRQLESLSTVPLQQSPVDNTHPDTTIIGNSPVQPPDTQQTFPSGLPAPNRSEQDTLAAPIPISLPIMQSEPVSTPLAGQSSPDQTLPNEHYRGKKKGKRNRLIGLLVIILVFVLLLPTILIHFLSTSSSSDHRPNTHPKNGVTELGEFRASNGQILGVNDGSSEPFRLGPDGQFKHQAVAQLKQKHNSQAISLWRAALHIMNNDAEAWIYLENQLVALSGLPYITLVAGTDLFEPSGSGQNDLQGIYVAQHEFNNANYGFRLRILIANSGTDVDNNVTKIAQQIVHIAAKDKTVVGVISWLSSAENLTALPLLAAAHIPMISPAASSDLLTNTSPFFFRIIPPNKVQGKETALFAENTLHAQKVVVFIDNNDPYSQNLAQVFEKQFRQDGHRILKEEIFTTDHTDDIGNLIQDAENTNPDLLYFTSRDTSDVTHFQDKLPTTGTFAHLSAIAGDSGYVIHPPGYGRWYLASFAFANAMDNAIHSTPPLFYQNYSDDFNEDGRKAAGYYGYTRPDDIAMLSYDVTSVFLKAIQQAIINNKIVVTSGGLQLVTPALLANTLPKVVMQGVTGQIAFGFDHDPVNKAIVFLAGTSSGFSMRDWRGCFTKDICQM